MTTFSWQLATDFTGDWNASASDWSPAGLPAEIHNYAADDIAIVAATTLAIGNFVGGDTFNSVTLDDPNGTFTISAGSGAMDVNTSLTLDSGRIVALGGAINLGSRAATGTLTIDGVMEGGTDSLGDPTQIQGAGFGPASLQGSGTIIAEAGLTDFETQAALNASSGLTLQISDDGNGANQSQLALEGTVNGGTVAFLGGSGLLILDSLQIAPAPSQTKLSGGTFGATIEGLTVGVPFTNGLDLYLPNIFALSARLSGSGNDTLTIWDTATPGKGDFFTFDLSGNYTGATAMVQPDAYGPGGFDVFLSSVCYGAGTSILTPNGETAVESLQVGDEVMTVAEGGRVAGTVKWVGHRDLVLGHHADPGQIAPIRFLMGALGDNLPRRDLILSPDHCLFIDGGLIPAKLLVNGMTIIRDRSMAVVSYHHIELERHAIVVAEGVEAETYLDTGNRAFFSNAGIAMLLHPELTINKNLRCWETDAIAPLEVRPEVVKPVWRRFADRAVDLGYTLPSYQTTTDAALRLLVDGTPTHPLAIQGGTAGFLVPAGARSVRLVSRTVKPGQLTPWVDDARTLGVAIRAITLRGRSEVVVIGADHRALKDGWHVPECAADGAMWRWTDGNAALPITLDGPYAVEVVLSETPTYIQDAAVQHAAIQDADVGGAGLRARR